MQSSGSSTCNPRICAWLLQNASDDATYQRFKSLPGGTLCAAVAGQALYCKSSLIQSSLFRLGARCHKKTTILGAGDALAFSCKHQSAGGV